MGPFDYRHKVRTGDVKEYKELRRTYLDRKVRQKNSVKKKEYTRNYIVKRRYKM